MADAKKEKFGARKFVDNILMKELKNFPDGIKFQEIIRQTILNFEIDELYIEEFIKKFYIEAGYIILKDKRLYLSKIKKEEDEENNEEASTIEKE